MADLPEIRLATGKPLFTHTGVDCFEPFRLVCFLHPQFQAICKVFEPCNSINTLFLALKVVAGIRSSIISVQMEVNTTQPNYVVHDTRQKKGKFGT